MERSTPFRYKKIWAYYDGIKDFIAIHWNTSEHSTFLLYHLNLKIKQMKTSFTWWNKNIFGNVTLRV